MVVGQQPELDGREPVLRRDDNDVHQIQGAEHVAELPYEEGHWVPTRVRQVDAGVVRKLSLRYPGAGHQPQEYLIPSALGKEEQEFAEPPSQCPYHGPA